jgi:hypothetical protein
LVYVSICRFFLLLFYSLYSVEIYYERKIKSRNIIRLYSSLAHERVHACNGLSEIKTEIEGNTRQHPTLTKSIR